MDITKNVLARLEGFEVNQRVRLTTALGWTPLGLYDWQLEPKPDASNITNAGAVGRVLRRASFGADRYVVCIHPCEATVDGRYLEAV